MQWLSRFLYFWWTAWIIGVGLVILGIVAALPALSDFGAILIFLGFLSALLAAGILMFGFAQQSLREKRLERSENPQPPPLPTSADHSIQSRKTSMFWLRLSAYLVTLSLLQIAWHYWLSTQGFGGAPDAEYLCVEAVA
jgi:hypothetical protein